MPVSVETITLDDFRAHLGESFSLSTPSGQTITAQLAEVNDLGSNRPHDARLRHSFSLMFYAPATQRLSQGIYPLQHPQLGSLELFVVPVGLDARGLQLQVIFNFA